MKIRVSISDKELAHLVEHKLLVVFFEGERMTIEVGEVQDE